MDRITPQPSTVSSQRPHFLMSIDVEDWFQVENFKPYIGFDSWPSRELRVEANTDRLLRLFQEARPGPEGSPHRDNGPVKATFFVLGWLAERLPGLIRRIAEQGHEIASHGFAHALNYQFTDQDLDQDLETSKKLLEDVSGTPVLGYRAPTFSINNRILARIKACGYRYDSSYNSVGLFQRSGTLDLPPAGAGTLALRLSPGFFELPISNLALGRTCLPWGGGRLFPAHPLVHFSARHQGHPAQDRGVLLLSAPLGNRSRAAQGQGGPASASFSAVLQPAKDRAPAHGPAGAIPGLSLCDLLRVSGAA